MWEINILFDIIKKIYVGSFYQFVCYNDKYIVLHNCGRKVKVYQNGLLHSVKHELTLINFETFSIIGDNLIFRNPTGHMNYINNVVCDLKNYNCTVYHSKYSYCQLLSLPNNQIAVCKGQIVTYPFLHNYEGQIRMYNSLTECFAFLNEPIMVDCNYSIISGKYHVAYVYLNISFLVSIRILDLNMCFIRSIELVKHHIPTNVIVVCNDIIYLWNTQHIWIIEGNNVAKIDNEYQIEIYNFQFDVFINSRLQLFRIVGGKLVRYQHYYDFWNDLDKPDWVVNVMDVLMTLELFPNEICNIVYSEVAKKLKK